eukprot:gnl/TRDRNA2_/TRDRNA2_200767_c0_seq1.p1 gnl/TRDRNA2_/TRDRNA2_200767_c0~~gnl/TRDRNA2_/TRDRNA2_200767_c0_seq1.p1  ORF type:complete len:121 (+),score=4.76 gnl/TRDRNA2_/TRDRNA2_200767_c0_seq1:45-407(+)
MGLVCASCLARWRDDEPFLADSHHVDKRRVVLVMGARRLAIFQGAGATPRGSPRTTPLATPRGSPRATPLATPRNSLPAVPEDDGQQMADVGTEILVPPPVVEGRKDLDETFYDAQSVGA